MTASPDSLQQRYEAIERVYSERQWDDVARLSEELLLELPDEPGHPLRQRLQLLLGHTYLYGYRDAATATGFYSRVRAATSETVLRDIADQGLEQCASQASPDSASAAADTATPNGSGAVTGQAFPLNAEPVAGTGGAAGAVPAMPWMEQLGEVAPIEPVAPIAPIEAVAAIPSTPEPQPEPELVVEVIEEPELIDVAQADPARAEELDVAITAESSEPKSPVETSPVTTITSLSPEEIAELSKGLLRVVIR